MEFVQHILSEPEIHELVAHLADGVVDTEDVNSADPDRYLQRSTAPKGGSGGREPPVEIGERKIRESKRIRGRYHTEIWGFGRSRVWRAARKEGEK